MGYNELAGWLIKQCEERNLSWSEVSRRAGVSENTISQIVGGTKPGNKRLTALAEYFDVPVEIVFRMADILPVSTSDDIDPEIRHTVDKLIALFQDAKELGVVGEMRTILEVQAEACLAVARASAGHTVKQDTPTEIA